MSKFKDIEQPDDKQIINISSRSPQDQHTQKKYTFRKSKKSFVKIKDLTGSIAEIPANTKSKFTPPVFLSNLLRVSIVGVLIVFTINTLSVYGSSKNIENQIIDQAYQGYNYLTQALSDSNNFAKAKESFTLAEEQLWFISSDNSIYAKEGNLGYALKNLLEIGQHFAIAGEHFTEASDQFNKIPLYFVSRNSSADQINPSITDALKKGLESTDLAITEIDQASNKITKVNIEILPEEIKEKFLFAKSSLTQISSTLNSISKHFPAILELLGDRYPQRIMVLLQNNNETRPTGGFIGSYAILDINDGYIENLKVHDVYDIDGSYGGKIEPPEDVASFIGNWRLRDSNYSPDFAIAAEKARWFLETQGGPSVDTVIAINQGLLKEMLKITGPVQVGDFGSLTSENYNLILSYIIEGKFWGKENPKHILKIFVPAFQKQILKPENISEIGAKTYRAIQQKHILFYSQDTQIQALFDYLDLSARVHPSKQGEDYLSVINFSIGGNKSDQFIEQKIDHFTNIAKDGTVTNDLTITRKHLWEDGIYQKWEAQLQPYNLSLEKIPDHILEILGRGDNVVSTRIYVPTGVEMISSSDPNIELKHDSELNKDYFLTKIKTPTSQQTSFKVKYKLGQKLDFKNSITSYKIFIEKQPGTIGSILNKKITSDPSLTPLKLHPTPENYNTTLLYDQYFSGIWQK